MKKTLAALLAAALALTGLTACEGTNTVEETTPPYPVTVGNVTVSQRPKAVASLTPALTDILLDLGYQNRIVGYPTDQDIPDPLPEPESVSSEEPAWWQFWVEQSSVPVSDPAPSGTDHIGTAMEPDLPVVGELKPEIIFTGTPFTKAHLEKLTQVGIQVVVMPAVTTVEELKNRYVDVMKVMEGQLEADTAGLALSDSIQSKLDFLSARASSGGSKSFLFVNTLDPMISTPDTYEGQLLSLIGTNLAADKRNYTVEAEALAEYDPDVILYASPVTPEELAASEQFKDKAAVVNGSLIAVDAGALLDQTQNVTEALRSIAAQLYPGVDFTEPEPVSSDVSGEAESGGAASDGEE